MKLKHPGVPDRSITIRLDEVTTHCLERKRKGSPYRPYSKHRYAMDSTVKYIEYLKQVGWRHDA